MSGTRQFVSPEGFSPKRGARRRILAAALVAAVAGCGGITDLSRDLTSDAGDTDTDVDTDSGTGDPVPLTALDLLVVIDNTYVSPGWTNPVLAQNLFAFTSSLMHPLQGSGFAAIDDIRIAAISPNMGLSANGESMDDYWPGTPTEVCEGLGDDGVFQGVSVPWIELQNDVIPCDASAAQCPSGWTCSFDADAGTDGGTGDSAEGVCHTDGDTLVACPALDGAWGETTAETPSGGFAALAGCLGMQEAGGCLQQPLQSARTALGRPDQSDFVREEALLVLLAVTNDEDCSLEDGPEMIAEDEMTLPGMNWDLACYRHGEHLFSPVYLYEAFVEIRGRADAVAFAAIAGVPYGDQPGAAACQGRGDLLGTCLEQDEMQIVEDNTNGEGIRYVCEGWDNGDYTIAYAWPGRRFVQLAADNFGANGYVYSICNEDWTPAFDALGAMIRGKLSP